MIQKHERTSTEKRNLRLHVDSKIFETTLGKPPISDPTSSAKRAVPQRPWDRRCAPVPRRRTALLGI